MTGGSTQHLVRVRPLPPGRRDGARRCSSQAAAQQWKRARRRRAAPRTGVVIAGDRARVLRRAGGRPRRSCRRRRRSRSRTAKDWKLIGKPTKRLDSPREDHRPRAVRHRRAVPRAAHRARRAPAGLRRQGRSRSTAAKALAVPGVREVVQVPTGVAVVADHFWAAKLGRDALDGRLGSGRGRGRSTPTALARAYRALAGNAGREGGGGRRRRPRRCRRPRRRVEAEYDVPVPRARADGAAQLHRAHRRRTSARSGRARSSRPSTRRTAAKILGLKPEQVKIHTHVPRRRLRPARDPDVRLRARGGARRQGGGRAGQDGLDARGRHARRLLPPAVRPPRRGSASTRDGRAGRPGSTRSSASRSSLGTPFERR